MLWNSVTKQSQQLFMMAYRLSKLPIAVAFHARRICGNGVSCIDWQQISVGRHKAGLGIDVLVSDSMIHIFYNEELLKTALRSNSKEVRKRTPQS
jgi:hypothetical protein